MNELAWPLIDPDRKDWGGEAKGLVLARRAVELAATLSPEERAGIRDSLAWALYANGRFDEALAEEAQALEEAPAERKEEFEGYVARLKEKIEEEIAPEEYDARMQRVDEIEKHVAALEAEVSRRPEWQFADAQDKWWHNQLEKLVEGVKAFSDPEAGLASSGTSAEHGWGVARRAEIARTIAERSLTGSEASAKWAEALALIADLAECPAYGGLITAQLGLLPIGRDPESGLWEFAHLQTGEPARRGPDGKLILTETTGVVFVLLPDGTFQMGAQKLDPSKPNYDPGAAPDESPVHAVTLAPFFLSKYEMTQAQWQCFAGENPSVYGSDRYSTGWNAAGKGWSGLHAVEQVSWEMCVETLDRLGLVLPTEAQWEYGCRAGTSSVYWCGDEKESLQGVANLSDAYGKSHGNESWGEWEPWLDDGQTVHAEVGTYRANVFGLHDVHGNVWEWCRDGYGGYGNRVRAGDGAREAAGSASRVYRGGGSDGGAANARSAYRLAFSPEYRDVALGLRVARGVSP